jgi:hypothetical protein
MLEPPKNVRTISPRCCATCKHRKSGSDGDNFCERLGEDEFAPWGDPQDMHLTVCDGFSSYKKPAK